MIAAVCLSALLLCLAACGGSDGTNGAESGSEDSQSTVAVQQTAELTQVEKETAAQMIRRLTGEEIGPGCEWSIIGIAGSSMAKEAEAQSLFMQYEESLRIAVKRTEGVLDPERPTDNAKAVIALQMIGGDPGDVEGFDLLDQLENTEVVKEQGVNAQIWALNAASCCGRHLDAQETYIGEILAMQMGDGSFTYDGQTADVDITAMAMQALAPFAGEDQKIADALANARSWLAQKQQPGGDYGSSESTSQVIMALAAMGEDPAKSEDFTKKGGSLIDGLLQYRCADGFCHLQGDEMDVMATEQALCAIDSAQLAAQGEKLF